MKNKCRLIYFLLALLLLISTTGCSSGKNYSSYVKGLLDMNYKGEFKDYIHTTNSSKADANAIYEASMSSLADTYISYYGITIVDSGETKAEFVEVVKQIYEKSNYEVSGTRKIEDTYFVDVTVSPMDILDITHDDIVSYIASYNDKIKNGEFDAYELDQYEQEYTDGILQILEDAIPNISYKESTTVTVPITTGDYYSMSDTDFLTISQLLITDGYAVSTEED